MESFETEVQSKIKETLINYKKLIKLYLKNNIFFLIAWKNMNLSERANFARALVYMESVAENSKKYLSKEETGEEWSTRVKQYVAEKGVSVEDAYDIVPCPCDFVYERCAVVLKRTPYNMDYCDFLVDIQNYEYASQIQQKFFRACCIVSVSERVKNLLAKKKENKWLGAMKMMKGFDENKR